jgi:hypothetical protein
LNIIPFTELLLLPKKFLTFLVELLLLPKKFLTFPVGSTIATKEDVINIKGLTNEALQIIDFETHIFARNRKTEVPITLKLHMKTQNHPNTIEGP